MRKRWKRGRLKISTAAPLMSTGGCSNQTVPIQSRPAYRASLDPVETSWLNIFNHQTDSSSTFHNFITFNSKVIWTHPSRSVILIAGIVGSKFRLWWVFAETLFLLITNIKQRNKDVLWNHYSDTKHKTGGRFSSTYRTLYWMKQNNGENLNPLFMKINKSFSLSHRSPVRHLQPTSSSAVVCLSPYSHSTQTNQQKQ